jgi:tripartite-type tricarboxylate transporter receptor subunit TctC
VRLIAVTGAERWTQYPAVPTIAESGFPGYSASAWQMLLVPAGTPKPIVAKINAEVAGILKSPDIAQRLLGMGIVPSGIGAADTEAFLRAEMAKWGEVVKVSGAKID